MLWKKSSMCKQDNKSYRQGEVKNSDIFQISQSIQHSCGYSMYSSIQTIYSNFRDGSSPIKTQLDSAQLNSAQLSLTQLDSARFLVPSPPKKGEPRTSPSLDLGSVPSQFLLDGIWSWCWLLVQSFELESLTFPSSINSAQSCDFFFTNKEISVRVPKAKVRKKTKTD